VVEEALRANMAIEMEQINPDIERTKTRIRMTSQQFSQVATIIIAYALQSWVGSCKLLHGVDCET
jgi:hypothetical protein